MSQNEIVTLITGAERGMGLVEAKTLSEHGQHVFMGAYDMDLGQKSAKELQDQGLDVTLVACDITDRDQINATIKTIDDKYGYLNILINNAGISGPEGGLPSETDEKDLRRVFETNFFGTSAMTHAAVPLLKKAPFGKIITVTSDMGSLGLALDQSSMFSHIIAYPYQASKTALNAMTVAYSKEFKGTNITANSVNPGMTATDLVNKEEFEKNGAKTVESGAHRIIELALDPKNDANGTFTEDAGIVPW
ncbi:SDR family NAD(P)-dependent oxidoreductase [Secundilactobacillus folii]|uniref:SDR family NAD(P)-dependent oxidoreductase n=1 Tax=Secundilactobacillus folii TaxID=2678357 RepID=A0A7X2XW24_9LACO|nr:SDR family NAD(P)-dependent oxidoreductase [Secundilactobacillus folii]MTV82729.1 SDR family NAD(P)-dependent oxidoreductase [Secundilactobacillus folii]